MCAYDFMMTSQYIHTSTWTFFSEEIKMFTHAYKHTYKHKTKRIWNPLFTNTNAKITQTD